MMDALTFRCGHLRSEENIYWHPQFGRHYPKCRACKRTGANNWAREHGWPQSLTPAARATVLRCQRRARLRRLADPVMGPRLVEQKREWSALMRAKARAYDQFVDTGDYWSDVKEALATGAPFPAPPVAGESRRRPQTPIVDERTRWRIQRAKAKAYDRLVDIGTWWSDVKVALITRSELPPPPIADLNPFVEDVA